MSHCPWSPVSTFGRYTRLVTAACILCIGIAIIPTARANHAPASCPSEVEKVAYPEQYGWYPCPFGTAWPCPSSGHRVVEFLASHPSAGEACRDLHLVYDHGPARWVLQGNACVIAPPHSGTITYTPSQMPYCRDPRDGYLKVPPCWYLRCKDTQQYVLKLTTVSNTAESSTTIRSIEPSQTTSIVARVYDQANRIVPNVNVRLETDAVPNSGGHRHHTGRPKGSLDGPNPTPHIITGSTGSNGFPFVFKAPTVAGDHKIKASCTDITCSQQGPDTVWVGIKELIPLPNASTYELLRNRDENHLDNHYMAYGASIKLMQLADLYRRRFPGDPLLRVNDASLERGGLFDIDSNWSHKPKGHKLHRRGTEVDIRANPDFNPKDAIPVRNFEKFEETALEVGGEAEIHSPGGSNQHYHVVF